MRVRADLDRCVGSGNCALALPQVFDQDDDGLVVVLDERPPARRHDDVRTAVLHCPAAA
ncbi:ferredoxin [Dactylosporangium sp. NPDC048998]|uniref:ferredoxin n=1 Tax=Dactylosporangium sp. NPDC048998 TaxID=3363976 RepID=UPI0037210236